MDYLHDLETGPDSPNVVYAVIETPKGNENKYEYDVKREIFVLDRVLSSPVHFPGDYGFIPRTLDEDGDPLDILVLVTNPTFPGCTIAARPIALLGMIDGTKRDDKVLAVPRDDPRFNEFNDMQDIPDHILKETAYLFETYKTLEGKKVKILGWQNAAAAKAMIRQCQQLNAQD